MEIAVLLGGGVGDRYAILHAVALAKRAGETVHAIRQGCTPPHASAAPVMTPGFGLALLSVLAEHTGVRVRHHALAGRDMAELRALLRQQRVNCLVVGAGDETERRRAERRLEDLRRSLPADRHWAIKPFWALVTGPWSDEELAGTLADYPNLALETL